MRHRQVLGVTTLIAAAPAHAHGEEALLILGIDVVLLFVAIGVITLALKCPAWMRVLLACVYLATLTLLLFLPIQLFPSLGPLNGPLHFALPWLVAGVAFMTWRLVRPKAHNEAT